VETLLAISRSLISWHLDPFVVLGLLAIQGLYLFMVERLWRKTGTSNRRAMWFWSLGILTLFVALESPLDSIGERSLLLVHMVQHELLFSVAPPLLLLGLFPRLVTPLTRPVLKPLLRTSYTHRLLQAFFSPYCTLVLWLLLLYAWHLPALYLLALRSSSIHILEHLCFVVAGTLFWQQIIEPVPGLVKMQPGAKIIYLAVGQIGLIPLVVVLVWSPSVLYSYYTGRTWQWGITALVDQHVAGLLMMGSEMLVALTAVGWITLKALAFVRWQEERPRPPASGQMHID